MSTYKKVASSSTIGDACKLDRNSDLRACNWISDGLNDEESDDKNK